MSYKLLLVDDDRDILMLNGKYLTSQNYVVKLTTHPMNVLKLIDEFKPDCIILDVMMPEKDGFSLCSSIRTKSNIPIIFLSGKVTEDDRINGLLLGADDYITKPYSLRELSVRIQTCIRRHQKINTSIIQFPPLSIDSINHKVFFNDEEIILSNREYELLLFLVEHKDTTVTFEEIANKMWNSYTESDRRSIMVNTSRLRKKLDEYPGLGNMIETVWSQGYKFVTK